MLEADSHLNFERQQKLGLKGTFVGAGSMSCLRP